MANPTNPGQQVDLASLFGAVANSLSDNIDGLNEADTRNQNHGNNMVSIFNTITKVVQSQRGKDQASQLAAASKELRKQPGGSAQLYADGLQRAASMFQGSIITPQNAGALIQALLGGGQPAQPPQQQAQSQGGGLLGSLMGALAGGQQAAPQTQPAQSGLDVGDMLNLGLTFMNAYQNGGGHLENMVGSLLSTSPMGQADHRSQSGTLVAQTIMEVLGNLINK